MDIRAAVRSDPRRAGAVRRYHTWPTIQTQTVAEASWNVARILLQIWPGAVPKAISHALLNDCGEIKCGDLPFPIKRDNPVLKEEIVRLEEESFREQKISHLANPDGLAQVWLDRVKICDMIEMWEFGLDEVALGNKFALPIIEGTMEDVFRLCEKFDLLLHDRNSIREYMECRQNKTPQ